MNPHCVIVGAGHGAAQLCASLRQAKWEGTITLIGDEPLPPYHRPPLSKTRLDPAGDTDVQLIRPADFYPTNHIQLLTGERVERIDRNNKTVHTASHTLPYDTLVLSLGSIHRIPPIQGIDHPRVHNLRTAADAEAIRNQIPSAKRAVVIGAGFIGLEVAASLRKQNLEVTVLEMAPRVLARVAGKEVSSYFEQLHRDHGVDIRTSVSVKAIRESGNGLEVLTADGDSFAADFVVMGTGAAANSRLAEDAGLKVEDGIVVNEFNQTSDPDILAIGDCCRQKLSQLQKPFRLESVQNALDQAKTAAAFIIGRPTPHTALPWFWSDQYDVKLQIAGVSIDYDQIVLRGTPLPGESFSAWYFCKGELQAVDAVNDSTAYAVATKLLKAGLHPDPALIEDTAIETKTILTATKEKSDA